jgi:BirA family biotin operon repressor/biotin-[acetyl-CoA-carboxylase] ligase
MFNIEEFDIKLDTEVLGRNFVYCAEVDSTNTMLLENKEFDIHGTVFMAEYQTGGKCRKEDRQWLSNKEQNLTFSILLKEDFSTENVSVVIFATALSVAQAIENLYQLKVDLKWPNDVMINKAKCAGILLESTSKGSEINKIVIGIGINVNQPTFPGKYMLQPTSIKKEFKETVSRERLLSELLNILEENLKLSQLAPQKIMSDWKSRCKMIGEKVKIEEGDSVKHGIFEDVDDNGCLLLKVDDKIEKIHFGDVSLR